MKKYAIDLDITKCISCGACSIACMDQNDFQVKEGQRPFRNVFDLEMEQKGNVTYPRPQMELVCVLDEAEQAGHLMETIVAEFTEHPFSMPALWACRDHFYRLDAAASLPCWRPWREIWIWPGSM